MRLSALAEAEEEWVKQQAGGALALSPWIEQEKMWAETQESHSGGQEAWFSVHLELF